MSASLTSHKELRRTAASFRKGLLGRKKATGMCFAVCAPLQGYLAAVMGIETELVEVQFPETNHVWLQIDADTILDPTADQFGLPSVYIGPVPEVYREWMSIEMGHGNGT